MPVCTFFLDLHGFSGAFGFLPQSNDLYLGAGQLVTIGVNGYLSIFVGLW